MSDIFDYEPDPFDSDGEPEHVECKICRMSGLHWEDFGSGWKLYDENLKRHVCPSQRPSADDFEALQP